MPIDLLSRNDNLMSIPQESVSDEAQYLLAIVLRAPRFVRSCPQAHDVYLDAAEAREYRCAGVWYVSG